MSALTQQTLEAHLADGRVLTATAENPDYLRWELTAAKERWPTVETHGTEVNIKAPMLYTTFLAWAALNRSGQYAGKWEQFSQTDCVAVLPASEQPVDPTQPEADSGS